MNLCDIATKEFLFEKTDEKQGLLRCRKCGREVFLMLEIKVFIILATSKVNIVGKWCDHYKMSSIIKTIVKECS